MRSIRSSILFALASVSLSFADPVLVPNQPMKFDGGLNLTSEVGDGDTVDSSNFIDEPIGAISKRNGSRRFNAQAISSNPITSMFRVYASSGNGFLRALLLTSRDKIYVTTSSFDLPNPVISTVAHFLAWNDNWHWVMMANQAIGMEESLQDDIKSYDVATSSLTNLIQWESFIASESVRVRGKYPLQTRNYLLLANCALVSSATNLNPSTTYYNSRIYYSLLGYPSSFTAARFINIKTDDGEPLTGISETNQYVHAWKETSIAEIDFTVLNLTGLGGDQVVRTKVDGFGLYAPDTLANIGDGYIFGAKDGIRFWDGGRKSRLQVENESRIVSDKIQPIINRLIKFGTYKTAKAKLYPKKQWYVLSYDDPLKPQVGYDSILVLDLKTFNWFEFKNWNAESFEVADGIGDKGQLLYGGIGQIYFADDEYSKNDARRELVIDSMDSSGTWVRGAQNVADVIEGTGSVKFTVGSPLRYSSMTSMSVYNFNLWKDGSRISAKDKLNFKVYPTSITNLVSLRVDLELTDNPGSDFDTLLTSVTISSAALLGGNSTWAEVSISLSSFPILSEWMDLSIESAPFANTQVYFGMRFFATGTAGCALSIDDIRIVESKEQALNAYWYTKLFDFGTPADKRFRKVFINKESPKDGKFYITSFNDFGEVMGQQIIDGGFQKQIYVSGYNGNEGISVLDSINLDFLSATNTIRNYAAFRSMAADKTNLFAADIFNNKIWKFDKSTSPANPSFYGSFGHGTTNFYDPFQIAMDDKDLYIADFGNHRIKVHSKSDLSFSRSFGELGRGTTNCHLPTGVAVNKNKVFIADDGNQRIMELTKSTFGFVREIIIPLASLGNMRLLVDEKYLYVFYGNQSSTNSSFTDLILEKRDLVNPENVVSKKLIYPSTNTTLSNGIVMGDIGQNDEFVYLSFTNMRDGTGLYYLQKLFKDDFSLSKEYVSGNSHYAIAGNGLAYLPKRSSTQEIIGFEGSHIQLKYSDDQLDNNLKLYSQSFLVTPQPLKEKD